MSHIKRGLPRVPRSALAESCRGQDKLPESSESKEEVRAEAAEDLGFIVAERNPVVRTIKDGYDTADALERLRTGERKPLIDEIRDR